MRAGTAVRPRSCTSPARRSSTTSLCAKRTARPQRPRARPRLPNGPRGTETQIGEVPHRGQGSVDGLALQHPMRPRLERERFVPCQGIGIEREDARGLVGEERGYRRIEGVTRDRSRMTRARTRHRPASVGRPHRERRGRCAPAAGSHPPSHDRAGPSRPSARRRNRTGPDGIGHLAGRSASAPPRRRRRGVP